MMDLGRFPRGWIDFAGVVLLIAVLHWAQPIIVPIMLAVLLTFILTPIVNRLQRWVGKVAAVLLVALLTFGALGLGGWAVGHQMTGIVQDLPRYRDNIRQKVRDIRNAGKSGSVKTFQDAVADIQHEIDKGQQGTEAAPMVVQSSETAGLWGIPSAVGSWFEPLANTGFVGLLVSFMLLERQELRNRLIKLFGYGHLAVTTRALDEAGRRVSGYLLRQSLINVTFGVCVAIGLSLIGVPYAVLWGCLAAALRFIPFLGIWIAVAAPLAVSLAVLEGWMRPLEVLALFAALELTINMVVEPLFYSDAAGVSKVGLLISIAFWTWIWGPTGLLMATPLTVCIVVLGKYAPGLDFLSTLMGEDADIDVDVSYYQRLLAGDQLEAMEIVTQFIGEHGRDAAYDAILLPALNYGERDRLEGRLSVDEEAELAQSTNAVIDEIDDMSHDKPTETEHAEPLLTVLGCPVEGKGDVAALHMLAKLMPVSMSLQVLPTVMSSSDLIGLIKAEGHRAICIADLPPSSSARSRYLAKRLRAALPDLKIIVGRWGPTSFADEDDSALLAAGADSVTQTLLEARTVLAQLEPPQPNAAVA